MRRRERTQHSPPSPARPQIVYLAFFNLLWVWVPLIVGCDSGAKIVAACDKAKVEASDDTPVGSGWWTFAFASIVLYSVIVPAVMLTSAA